MALPWYFEQGFRNPFAGNSVEETCTLAHDHFGELLDEVVASLPDERQPSPFDEWQAEDYTLAQKVNLIFPAGLGDYDEDRNHNPAVFPVLIELERALQDDSSEAFVHHLCKEWGQPLSEGFGPNQTQFDLLQRIFLFFTAYLQLFPFFCDTESPYLSFKYPPNQVQDSWTRVENLNWLGYGQVPP